MVEPQNAMPADEYRMSPRPEYRHPSWTASAMLSGKRAVITGGDSGIGRAVALLFAQEGADIVVGYLSEDVDAEERKRAGASRPRSGLRAPPAGCTPPLR